MSAPVDPEGACPADAGAVAGGGLFRRAVRRIIRHRWEATVVLAFLIAITALAAGVDAFSRLAHALGHAPGVLGALVVGMALLWLPLGVIDARRCTRETALRAQVEADLERQLAAQRAQQEERHAVITRVRAVLDTEELSVVYQPIVEMRSGLPVAYEALSRFPDSVAPDQWFAQAASVELGTELEALAIRSALAGLPALPGGVTVCVNASPGVLSSPEIVSSLCGPWSARLAVEITEHAIVDNYHRFRETIAHVRRCGALLVVDDAGAGYASFRHIVDLSPDVIKLDGSLVRGVETDPARRSLVSAFVSFASDIGALLVAECVETEDEAAELQRRGVRFGQGWLYGRPASLGTIVEPGHQVSAPAARRSNHTPETNAGMLVGLVDDVRCHRLSSVGTP